MDMLKFVGILYIHFGMLDASVNGAELGASIYGAELGARVTGAELPFM